MKTQFQGDSRFSGPVASLESKTGGRAERGEALTFAPVSSHRVEARINRVVWMTIDAKSLRLLVF